jgi:phosphoglycerate dehydrogenase-like enzyme
VCNVFEHEIPVAEFVIAAILDHTLDYGLMRRAFDSEQWAKTYAARRPHGEVHGKVMGLIGYGSIGRAVTQRAKALGLSVRVISRSGRAQEADWAGRPNELQGMLPLIDYLVIACPLTPETRGMIGAAELDLMKPTTVVINVARAQVIDEQPLYEALRGGRLRGATLDVWYQYPVPGALDAKPSRFPFHELPHVHCTAHSSAWSEELFERRYAVIADNLSRLRESAALRNVISMLPKVGTGSDKV